MPQSRPVSSTSSQPPVDDIPDNITASGLLDMIIDGRRLGDLTPREAMAWVARVNAELAERKRRVALISAAYGLDPKGWDAAIP